MARKFGYHPAMQGLDHLPRDALQRLTRELAGEKILWAGQPSPARAFWKSAPLLLFAIPWTAFALAWEALSLGAFFNTGVGKVTGPGGILTYVFPIFGLPFVVVGFGMLAAPLWAARKAGRTVHVLTDKRLVTAVLGGGITLKSIEPARIFEITRREGAGGIGTMTISLGKFRDSDGDAVEKTEDWVGVADVKLLEDRLRAVMEARRAG